MALDLIVACDALGAEIGKTDPGLFAGSDCAALVEVLARTEKRCAGLRALLAARAAQCGAHKERGYSDAAAWLGDASGVSTGEAKAVLDTAQRLDACPDTRDAVLAGGLSMAQAGEITKTEAAAPGSEAALLDLAARVGVTALKDDGRRRRLLAQDSDDAHRRQHRERFWRHWQDDQGMIRVAGAFPPEMGVPLVSRVDAEVNRMLRKTQQKGDPAGAVEPRQAVAADAVAHLVLKGDSGRPGRPPDAEVVLVCDVEAFQRGHTQDGEVCHIIGGGPFL